MNFKQYQATTKQLEAKLIKDLPFWQARRFLPSLHLYGNHLYLSSEDSADGMDAKELLLFIRCMVQFGGYTKEEVFDENKQDDDCYCEPYELEDCEEDNDYGPSSEEERLARLAQSMLDGIGKPEK
jgi:hypothetical protein